MKNKNFVQLNPNNPKLHKDSFFEEPCVIQPLLKPNSLIKVGAYSGVYGNKSNIYSCSIGRYCSIADTVTIGPSEHPTSWLSSSMIQYVDSIHNWNEYIDKNVGSYNSPSVKFIAGTPPVLGNDVWVGAGAFIKNGITVGNGAIISAGSIVVKDVPDYAIVGGTPAKIIRYRFQSSLIEKLLRSKWWDYHIAGVSGIDFSNPEKAVDTINDLRIRGLINKIEPRYNNE